MLTVIATSTSFFDFSFLKLEFLVLHIEDVSYVGLYKEYIRMKKDGCKTTYIVVYLAEKYRISERKVYTLLKRLSQNCEPLER